MSCMGSAGGAGTSTGTFMGIAHTGGNWFPSAMSNATPAPQFQSAECSGSLPIPCSRIQGLASYHLIAVGLQPVLPGHPGLLECSPDLRALTCCRTACTHQQQALVQMQERPRCQCSLPDADCQSTIMPSAGLAACTTLVEVNRAFLALQQMKATATMVNQLIQIAKICQTLPFVCMQG